MALLSWWVEMSGVGAVRRCVRLLTTHGRRVHRLRRHVSKLRGRLDGQRVRLSGLGHLRFKRDSRGVGGPRSLRPVPLFPRCSRTAIRTVSGALPPVTPSRVISTVRRRAGRHGTGGGARRGSGRRHRHEALELPSGLRERIIALCPSNCSSRGVRVVNGSDAVALREHARRCCLGRIMQMVYVGGSRGNDARPQIVRRPLLPQVSRRNCLNSDVVIGVLMSGFYRRLPRCHRTGVFHRRKLSVPADAVGETIRRTVSGLCPVCCTRVGTILHSPCMRVSRAIMDMGSHGSGAHGTCL